MSPLAHSAIGPSSSKRWMNCPGSVRLSVGIESKESSYARHGSAVHEVCERCLREDKQPEVFINVSMTNGYTIDEADAKAAKVFVDFVRQLHDAMELPEPMLIEQRFDLSWIFPGMFGTADCVLKDSFNHIYVIDYKNGVGVNVEAEGNSQAMYYGLGAIGKGNLGMFESITLVIVQPRVPNEEPIKTWTLSVDELMEWGEKVLKPAAERTADPKSHFSTGDWCRFCPASHICPKLRKKHFDAAQLSFDAIPMPDNEIVLPAPKHLTDEQISGILQLAQIMPSWVDSVKEYAKEELGKGRKIPGFKLVHGRASRSWSSEKELFNRLSKYKGELYNQKLKTPKQVEDMLKAKGLNKNLVKDLINVKRGVSLAPASDKREALLTAAEMFTEIE